MVLSALGYSRNKADEADLGALAAFVSAVSVELWCHLALLSLTPSPAVVG